MDKNYTLADLAAMGTVRRAELMARNAGASEVQRRDCGEGVGSVAHLQDCGPVGIDGFTGEGIDVSKGSLVEVHTVDQAKGHEAPDSGIGAPGGGAADNPVELTFRIEDGNPTGVARMGVVALVVYQGQYLVVDGEGVHTADRLRGHIGSRSGESLHSANLRMLGYFVKYVAKGA